MKFTRKSDNVIHCEISEQEITDLGYSLDEIMSNGERTQEFMNKILDMAEKEFHTTFDLGMKTVRADFRPDHTIGLTISGHNGSSDMMEHLKDIVSGLLASIPEEYKNRAMNEENGEEENPVVMILFVFDDMDTLIRFSHQIAPEGIPYNALYKYEERYYLIMDLSDCPDGAVKSLSMLTDEYASDIEVGLERKAFIEEHGVAIRKERALESLMEL